MIFSRKNQQTRLDFCAIMTPRHRGPQLHQKLGSLGASPYPQIWQEGSGLYLFERIVKNMSQINLLGDSLIKLPSLPNINQTLLLIQTHRCLHMSSVVSLDNNVPPSPEEEEESELSIQHKIQEQPNEIPTTTTITKKKKTGCTCKKTKCLKMYCECFREGKMCSEECSCLGCSNDHHHSDAIRRAQESISQKLQSGNKQQARGCNCKKSQCQKKYCECFNAGVACSSACKCEGCANGSCDDHRNSFDLKISRQRNYETESLLQSLE